MSELSPQPSPLSKFDNVTFETTVTRELLHRFQEELIEIKALFGTERASRLQRRMHCWSAVSNPDVRWALVGICMVGVVGSAFGALLHFGDADATGTTIWIGAALLFAVFGALFAMAPRIQGRINAWSDRLRLKVDARIEEQIRHRCEATPYTVRHVLDSTNRTWRLESQQTGEQTLTLSPEMTAYRGDTAFILLRQGLMARPLLSTAVETADQRRLLDEFLQSCGVRVIDARKLDPTYRAY
jgi:hypothetical protein